jgi:futalosine hydrolase
MKILIVAATYQEIEPFIKNSGLKNNDDLCFSNDKHSIKIVVSGVGMVATAYALGVELSKNNYDLAINVGVAGSFSKRIALGDVVQVTEDVLSELGAEDDEDFLSLEELELGETRFYQNEHTSYTTSLKKVNAITVNTVHGEEDSILLIKERLNPQIESMEGAAFFYACEEANIAGLQVRAISNYVEKRNKANWNMPLAILNLNKWILDYITKL